MKIYPLILAGGSGSRLWPLSREVLPKQLLPVVSAKTMLQETVLRLGGIPNIMPPTVVCGIEHRFLVAEQLRDIHIAPLGIILEPFGRNTAPAIACGTHYILQQDPEALVLVLPADHAIADLQQFHHAVTAAAQAAQANSIAMFGITADRAETGFGYIERGKPLSHGASCFLVNSFIEKPNDALALELIKTKKYVWNSGMFLFKGSLYLEELKQHRPQIALLCEAALHHAFEDLDFVRLDEHHFAQCPAESIDCAVMENTNNAVMVEANMGWTDLGSWPAVYDFQCAQHCAQENVVQGDVYLDDVEGCLVRAESRLVAVLGMRDVMIVETKDAVLIAHKSQGQAVKKVVAELQKKSRTEHINHRRVHRPWGNYEGLDHGERFQVKRITVQPGGRLSLQLHHHRAEHWIVVRGTAQITCGEVTKILGENESTFIPMGVKHRLENPGKVALQLIEVQSGSYLGEDDIVRFEDNYQRHQYPLQSNLH